MASIIDWLEAHDKLAGWAQFFGAIITLLLTYFTAFSPIWRRKRQLKSASQRLLLHSHEALESFHRTSGFFLPQAINLEGAALSIRSIVNEINKFPIYDLDDQGPLSTARKLVAVSTTLEATCLYLDHLAIGMGDGQMSEEERTLMRDWINDRLQTVADLISGKLMERPQASDFAN